MATGTGRTVAGAAIRQLIFYDEDDTMTPKTPIRNPIAEVFGETPLIDLTSEALRTGLARLEELGAEAAHEVEAIRQRAVDGIVNGSANFLETILKPDDEMDQAERWQRAVQAATEAARRALAIVEPREQDGKWLNRRAVLVDKVGQYMASGERLEKAISKLAQAFAEFHLLGNIVSGSVGGKFEGAHLFRSEQLQHLVNVALSHYSDSLWTCAEQPVSRGYISFPQNCEGLAVDVLNAFETRAERAAGRRIDWDAGTEKAAVAS